MSFSSTALVTSQIQSNSSAIAISTRTVLTHSYDHDELLLGLEDTGLFSPFEFSIDEVASHCAVQLASGFDAKQITDLHMAALFYKITALKTESQYSFWIDFNGFDFQERWATPLATFLSYDGRDATTSSNVNTGSLRYTQLNFGDCKLTNNIIYALAGGLSKSSIASNLSIDFGASAVAHDVLIHFVKQAIANKDLRGFQLKVFIQPDQNTDTVRRSIVELANAIKTGLAPEFTLQIKNPDCTDLGMKNMAAAMTLGTSPRGFVFLGASKKITRAAFALQIAEYALQQERYLPKQWVIDLSGESIKETAFSSNLVAAFDKLTQVGKKVQNVQLILIDCELQAEDVENFAILIEKGYVSLLDLSNNNLQTTKLEILGKALASEQRAENIELRLKNCSLTDAKLAKLFEKAAGNKDSKKTWAMDFSNINSTKNKNKLDGSTIIALTGLLKSKSIPEDFCLTLCNVELSAAAAVLLSSALNQELPAGIILDFSNHYPSNANQIDGMVFEEFLKALVDNRTETNIQLIFKNTPIDAARQINFLNQEIANQIHQAIGQKIKKVFQVLVAPSHRYAPENRQLLGDDNEKMQNLVHSSSTREAIVMSSVAAVGSNNSSIARVSTKMENWKRFCASLYFQFDAKNPLYQQFMNSMMNLNNQTAIATRIPNANNASASKLKIEEVSDEVNSQAVDNRLVVRRG